MERGSGTELRFRLGQASGRELQSAIDDLVAELTDPASEASEAAERAGIRREQLGGLSISAREDKAGVEPLSTLIVIAFAGHAGKQFANKVWDEIIWPRIKRSPLGGKAVGDKEE